MKDPIWFREWFKIVMREWALHLTMRQLAVVLFIMDRTAVWGKEWERIRYASFVNGVTNAEGTKRYSAGVCGSESTAIRITTELVTLGAIRRIRSREGISWSLNYEWQPSKMSTNTKSNLSKMTSSNLSKMTTRKDIHKRNASQKPYPAGKGLESIEEALAHARNKAGAARQRKRDKNNGRLTSSDVVRIWAAAVHKSDWHNRKTYADGRAYLTGRDSKALKSYLDRYLTNHPTKKPEDYLSWVVTSWPDLIASLFGWMTKVPPPPTPSALFLIKWAERFENAYMQGLALEEVLENGEDEDEDDVEPEPRKPRSSIKRKKKRRAVKPRAARVETAFRRVSNMEDF